MAYVSAVGGRLLFPAQCFVPIPQAGRLQPSFVLRHKRPAVYSYHIIGAAHAMTYPDALRLSHLTKCNNHIYIVIIP